MKFIAISVAALSLGANVLAAPTSLTGTFKSVPVANKLSGEVAGVADTATSALSKKAGSVMAIVTGSVTTLKSSVQSDLTSLSTYLPNPSCLYLLTPNL
jgi:hypothetical protein